MRVKAEFAQPAQHPVMMEARHEDRGALSKACEGGFVEVVAVKVRDVDVANRWESGKIVPDHLRQVPPALEVGWSNDPGIHQDADVLGLTQEGRVTNHLYAHQSLRRMTNISRNISLGVYHWSRGPGA